MVMMLTQRVKVAISSFLVVVGVIVLLVLPLFVFLQVSVNDNGAMGGLVSSPSSSEEGNNTLTATHRKLLLLENVLEKRQPDRIGGDSCTRSDILINQGPTAPLPNGIPTYTVEIMNVCVTGCNISRIHVSCGWFSSANLINPKIFKRLSYNDCLVNDGKPLANGGTIYFKYANTYLYPMSVSSVFCF